ncbi:MAG: hypothetical protein HC780_04580 [Leptolyngbyaceae cyanobacterium CSU_1_3]|nr:hypothetical protein [Leptolyngbyaceae cyanobacterium CSU_1_3]
MNDRCLGEVIDRLSVLLDRLKRCCQLNRLDFWVEGLVGLSPWELLTIAIVDFVETFENFDRDACGRNEKIPGD